MYLLDTHYVLWSLFEPDNIKEPIRQILENDQDTKFVSSINLWEISLKYSLGKLDLGDANPSDLFDVLLDAGFEIAEPQARLFATYFQLPKKEDHRDPFDRLLIWQAISNGYTLLTQDRKIAQYRANGLKLMWS